MRSKKATTKKSVVKQPTTRRATKPSKAKKPAVVKQVSSGVTLQRPKLKGKTAMWYGWLCFERFCRDHKLEALPASATTVARYIAETEVKETVREKLLEYVLAAQRAAGVSEDGCAELRRTTSAPTTKPPAGPTYLTAGSRSGGKFWEVDVVDREVRTRYGKLGTDGTSSSKLHPSPAAAADDAAKQTREKLRKGYVATPRPEVVSATRVSLADSQVEGTFYFRALDRWPGGNADMFVIKVTLVVAPGKAPRLSAKVHRNFDGEHWAHTAKTLTLPGAKTNAAAVLGAAQRLIDGGVRDGAFTIIDSRRDQEAYDTEWSWLEHSLQIDGTPVLRVTQKALTGAKSKSPPDATSQQFFDAVFQLVGLGRVEAYADGPTTFSTAFRKVSTGGSLGRGKRDLPLYL